MHLCTFETVVITPLPIVLVITVNAVVSEKVATHQQDSKFNVFSQLREICGASHQHLSTINALHLLWAINVEMYVPNVPFS